MAKIFDEDLRQISLKEREAGLTKVGDDSGAQLEGQVAGGEAQMVSSSKSKRGSSLARLPDDMLHYMTSFLLIKDVLRLDSAWTVRSEREKCWLPVLHKFFGRSPVLLETGKHDLIVSDSVFLRLSRAWINARSLPLARVIAPSEHGLSVELDRLASVTPGSFRSFKSDLAAVSSWLRANSLPAPKHTLDVIFTGNEIGATRALRRILSIEVNPPIQQVVDMGIVPRFVEFLQRSDNPVLQFEAAWALTNIAGSLSEHTQCVVDAGAVPILVKLLASPHQNVCEQAAWALGNVARDSVSTRDVVLQHGALPALVELGSTFSDATPLSLVRNVSRTLHNLCRKKPAPPLDLVSPALPLLARLIHNKDEKTVADACWALYHMSYGSNDRKEAVVQAGVAPRLVELLHDETKALSPALCTVGTIVHSDDVQRQRILDLNVLPELLYLLDHPKKKIRKDAVRAVSNITAGTRDQIQAVIEAGLVPKLIERLALEEMDEEDYNHAIDKQAGWATHALRNICSKGTVNQAEDLVEQGAVSALCSLLSDVVEICAECNTKVVVAILASLKSLLDKLPRPALLQAREEVLDADAVDLLAYLEDATSRAVSNRASAILQAHFSEEEDDGYDGDGNSDSDGDSDETAAQL